MVEARILSIQVGKPRVFSSGGAAEAWTSGIFKERVGGPIHLGRENLWGDGQADLAHHGGPDRAVLIFSQSNYPVWEAFLGKPLVGGSFGENLTVEPIDEDEICIGDIWEADEVVLEVSQPRLPCYKLSRRLDAEGFHLELIETRAAGWYCRTLHEGDVEAGQTLRLLARPHPDWTIRRAFHEFVSVKDAPDSLRELGGLPALSQLWKERIAVRVAKRPV